jgi:hypothetical protein
MRIDISTKTFLGVEESDKGILRIFFRGNKKTVTVMRVLISDDLHHCFSCPYNLEFGCNRTCIWLESNVNVLVGVRSVYGGLIRFRITPLNITWMRSKSYPSTITSNPYICNEKLNTEMGLASGVT